MLEARLADSPVKGVLLDLAAGELGHEGELASAMLARLRGWKGERPSGDAGGEARVVVFGPHVQAADLARAKRDGADVVMARGALAANLPRVLRELNGERGDPLRDQLTD